MIRAERIRVMSIEEMVEFFMESKNCCYCVHDGFDCDDGMCRDGIREYLEAEVNEQV